MSEQNKIRVGSRRSELALIQTNHVISCLKDLHHDKEFEVINMTTLGDRILDKPLPKIGEKSLFTKDLEDALRTGNVDFVVHSLKDLPTSLPEDMIIGAVLTREDPRDALVLQKDLSGYTLATLPKGSVIGTSSLRRTAQLAKNCPHLKTEDIRGNLNTRLSKLDNLKKYDAIVLAAAGLKRIGWTTRISKILEPDELLYAVGQGALAVECKANNKEILKLLAPLYDLQTALRVTAERSFLKTLGGGCSAPVAVCSELEIEKQNEIKITLNGAVWSLDGKEEIKGIEKENIAVKNGLTYTTSLSKEKEQTSVEKSNKKNEDSTLKEPPLKKQKTDTIDFYSKNTSLIDPHEHCPLKLPVGADFMGKCPFSEASHSVGTCPLRGCPQNNNEISKDVEEYELNTAINHVFDRTEKCENDNENLKLFCGLVPHKDATVEGMESAQKLGERLAQNLISKGALDVMAKAQSIIHASVSTATK